MFIVIVIIVIVIIIIVIGSLAISSVMLSSRISREEERNEIEKALKNPEAGEWIPVEERLPKENGYYLVTAPSCIDKEMVAMELYFDDGRWSVVKNGLAFVYEESITAWQPLPKPYKKENNYD